MRFHKLEPNLLSPSTPTEPTFHGFKMTNLIDNMEEINDSDGAKFYIARINEENCM